MAVSTDQPALEPCDLAAAKQLWAEYAAAHPAAVEACGDYVVHRFGDRMPLVDDLLALVISGTKRATAGLVSEYVTDGEPLPRIGGHLITCDGAGTPRVVLRTTELRIGPFSSVDAAFAFDEGENDRTLSSWMAGHRRYFDRVRAARGASWTDDDEVIFERFALVWPPELADS
jgi:uncharacterized protein YhfF